MKVSKYDDRIQFRVSRKEKHEAEQILLKENKSVAEYFRAKLEELLKRGK